MTPRREFEKGIEARTLEDFLRCFKDGKTEAVFYIRHPGYFTSEMVAPLKITDWGDAMQLIKEGGHIWPRVKVKQQIVFGKKEDEALEEFALSIKNFLEANIQNPTEAEVHMLMIYQALAEKVTIKCKEK